MTRYTGKNNNNGEAKQVNRADAGIALRLTGPMEPTAVVVAVNSATLRITAPSAILAAHPAGIRCKVEK